MKTVIKVLLVSWLHMVAGSAFAMTGDEILEMAERTLNAPKDRTIKEKMTLIKSDGSEKERTIMAYQKGRDERMVIFLAPADVEGVGFLALSEEQMYLYLPAFRKVRRIASHIKNESFVGTDFSYEDMSETEFTDEYTAELEREEKGQYLLELAARPEADVSYSRLRMWIDKETFIPVKTEYFSGRDGPVKRSVAENIIKKDGYWFPMKWTMETLKSGHRTVMEVLEIEHDKGLSDRFFNRRNLKRQVR